MNLSANNKVIKFQKENTGIYLYHVDREIFLMRQKALTEKLDKLDI